MWLSCGLHLWRGCIGWAGLYRLGSGRVAAVLRLVLLLPLGCAVARYACRVVFARLRLHCGYPCWCCVQQCHTLESEGKRSKYFFPYFSTDHLRYSRLTTTHPPPRPPALAILLCAARVTEHVRGPTRMPTAKAFLRAGEGQNAERCAVRLRQ